MSGLVGSEVSNTSRLIQGWKKHKNGIKTCVTPIFRNLVVMGKEWHSAHVDSSLLIAWCVLSLGWSALHTQVLLIWWLQRVPSIRGILLRSLPPLSFKKLSSMSENGFLIRVFLSPQYTRNNFWHHSDHWGQWERPTCLNHTVLSYGVAPRAIPNSSPPSRRRSLDAQQLCTAKRKHNGLRYNRRALQRPLGPLQVSK